MNRTILRTALAAVLLFVVLGSAGLTAQLETKAQHDTRLQWWREARFGMFIHWGLYALPAGEWNGKTIYGEWIRNNAQIPLAVYDTFLAKFNPVKFNADEWVRMAKAAGMKYIVITSKHHDGFALWDSKVSDFDVMATPFKRDILKELAEACRKQGGIRLCFYHSIMDWHHPDYLPRRDWEAKGRPAAGANFERYIAFMKAQLKELITNYGPLGVLWFDGEWESTWTEAYGRDLYKYVRSLQPDIIINNRVGASRSGMEGFSQDKESAGDFGTPEQTIPATGLAGVDWETCMTMNDNWGYNSRDKAFKSAQSMLRMLADIASKGGNYLLNVGPTAEGVFPPESIQRLKDIGAWMSLNGEAIYGAQASPFKSLAWGRCTRKETAAGTRLYLHVFDWPADGKLVVPGLTNKPKKAFLLADPARAALTVSRKEDSLVISVPAASPDANDAVVVLDLAGPLDVNDPPEIKADSDIFLESLDVALSSGRPDIEIRYTLDGTPPTLSSPLAKSAVKLTASAVVTARAFRRGQPVSGPASAKFAKVTARPADKAAPGKAGVAYAYFQGDWNMLPDFAALKPLKNGFVPSFDLGPKLRKEHYGFEFKGFVRILKDGITTFFTSSDDGSALYIGDERVVDNDGPHGLTEKKGRIALAAGWHAIRVVFFNATGSDGLTVAWQGAGSGKQPIPAAALAR